MTTWYRVVPAKIFGGRASVRGGNVLRLVKQTAMTTGDVYMLVTVAAAAAADTSRCGHS